MNLTRSESTHLSADFDWHPREFGCVFLLGCMLDSSSQAELIMGQPVLTALFLILSYESEAFVIQKCHIFWTQLLKSFMLMEWDVWDELKKLQGT